MLFGHVKNCIFEHIADKSFAVTGLPSEIPNRPLLPQGGRAVTASGGKTKFGAKMKNRLNQ